MEKAMANHTRELPGGFWVVRVKAWHGSAGTLGYTVHRRRPIGWTNTEFVGRAPTPWGAVKLIRERRRLDAAIPI